MESVKDAWAGCRDWPGGGRINLACGIRDKSGRASQKKKTFKRSPGGRFSVWLLAARNRGPIKLPQEWKEAVFSPRLSLDRTRSAAALGLPQLPVMCLLPSGVLFYFSLFIENFRGNHIESMMVKNTRFRKRCTWQMYFLLCETGSIANLLQSARAKVKWETVWGTYKNSKIFVLPRSLSSSLLSTTYFRLLLVFVSS